MWGHRSTPRLMDCDRELWVDTVPEHLVFAPGQFQWAQQHGAYLEGRF